MNYEFHPAAEAEHLESVAYYESRRPGLGASYLGEFEKIMGLVCESPQRYPIDKKPDIRRIRMKRFPFTILYRVASETIQVLAVAHHRRRPQYWLGRL
jgi:toxin ParE1/3/4